MRSTHILTSCQLRTFEIKMYLLIVNRKEKVSLAVVAEVWLLTSMGYSEEGLVIVVAHVLEHSDRYDSVKLLIHIPVKVKTS